ncbi:MAG: hypothetical protein KHY62_07055 [Firmicutes bacterium]|nr:hypothetical protein [Bacillota bacterium]
MNNNSGIIGIAAIIIIAAAKHGNSTDSLKSQGVKNPGYAGFFPGSFDLGRTLKDLHKVTDIINRMDSLGQMVLNPPPAPKLPSPGEFLGNSLPDLGGIIDNIGPILSILSKNNNTINDSYDSEYSFED